MKVDNLEVDVGLNVCGGEVEGVENSLLTRRRISVKKLRNVVGPYVRRHNRVGHFVARRL